MSTLTASASLLRTRPVAAAAITAAVLAAVIYAPSIGFDFVYDDRGIIVGDSRLADPAFGYQLWVAPWWPEGSAAPASRPLTTFTLWLQMQMHGAWPAAFHLVNVLLFAALSGAVAWMTWRWLGSVAAAWFAGLLFAVHPIHVEVAANGVGRAEIMAGLFMAIGLGLYLKWRPELSSAGPKHQPTPTAGWSWKHAGLIGLCLLAAGLSKEHGYFLAPMLGLIELARRHRAGVPLLKPVPWPIVLVIAIVAGLAVTQRTVMTSLHPAEGYISQMDNPLYYASASERLITPLKLIGKATALFIAPISQSPDYSPRLLMPTDELGDPLVLLGLAVVLTWLGLTIWAWRRRALALGPLLVIPVAWFVPSNTFILIGTIFGERLLTTLSMFLPVVLASLVVGRQVGAAWRMPIVAGCWIATALFLGALASEWSPYAEAGMLLANWSLAVLVVIVAAGGAIWLWHRAERGAIAGWIAMAMVGPIAGYATAAVVYSGVWKDDETLVFSTVNRHPLTGRFQGFMADLLASRGMNFPEKRDFFYAEAEQAARRALTYWPRQATPYTVLALVADHRGNAAAARTYLSYARRGLGKRSRALRFIEDFERRRGESVMQELAGIEQQLEQKPDDPTLIRRAAALHARLMDFDKAIELMAPICGPNTTDVPRLQEYATYLFDGGDLTKAHQVYQRLIQLEPDNWALLTDAAFVTIEVGDPDDQARRWIERAMKLSPGSAEPWAALGEWYRTHGQPGEAIAAYQQAIQRCDPGDPKLMHYRFMIEKITSD